MVSPGPLPLGRGDGSASNLIPDVKREGASGEQTSVDTAAALAQQGASSEIFALISRSKGNLQAVFQAVVERAGSLFEADHGPHRPLQIRWPRLRRSG